MLTPLNLNRDLNLNLNLNLNVNLNLNLDLERVGSTFGMFGTWAPDRSSTDRPIPEPHTTLP